MEYTKRLLLLVANLRKSEKVNSLDSSEEREADTLSHSLLDMEESFKVISNSLLPKLLDEKLRSEDVDDILFDIGEELRHISYHINDPKFYQYLRADG